MEVFGLEISQDSMVNWANEATKNAAPAIEKIKEYIKRSSVVGFDESGGYCNKRLDWAWIAQTVYFTLVFHGKSRKGQELEDRFGTRSGGWPPWPTGTAHTSSWTSLTIRSAWRISSRNANILTNLTRDSNGQNLSKTFCRKPYMNITSGRRNKSTRSHGLGGLTSSSMRTCRNWTENSSLSRTGFSSVATTS